MWKITVVIAVFIIIKEIQPAVSQLPCNSQLRTIRPNLFKHCSTCSYSQWSSWRTVDKAISKTCASGKTFKQIRTRHDLHSSCDQQNETQFICKNEHYCCVILLTCILGQPTTKEKAKLFIKSLDLGLTAIPSTISPTYSINNRNDTVIVKIVPYNQTVSLTRKKRALTDYCPSSVKKICRNTPSKELTKQYYI